MHTLPLSALAPRLAAGELRVADLVDSLLARIDATDATLRAWATIDRALLRRDAARLDALPPAARGPAFGLPMGVKDIIDTADLPTQNGSPVCAGRRPSADAACIARWRAAGGLVLGKTVTTEFAFLHPGVTTNPWNPGHTPGGSSSGSAASVATGQAPCAIGTQTNGSVIRPAAYCGVVGFKPTTGAIDFSGVNVFSRTFDVIGTFARSVADTAIVASVLAQSPPIARTATAPKRAPRFAYLERFPWTKTRDCDQDDTLDAAATHLRAAGAEVVPVSLPDSMVLLADVQRTIMLAEGAAAMGALQDRERARLSATLNAGLDDGRRVTAEQLAAARAGRAAMIATARDWLSHYDALIAPPAPSAAPEGLGATGDPSCCTFASLLGFPAITLPIGLSANRLPLGMQLVGRARDDDALLALAAWCEAKLPRWHGRTA
ncbi:MAG: amidase [Burkholderiales bacterium]